MADDQVTWGPDDGDEPAVRSTAPETASQLIRILDEYVEQLQAGTAPARAELIAAHPEWASQLAACLASLEFIHGAVRPDRDRPAVLGDFRILREIGRGGMGVVYEAEQISLKRPVALKVLRFGGVSDAEAMERFQREAETVAGLHHTNIVPIFAIGEENGVAYYAMQFIRGRSLADVPAARRAAGEGDLDPQQIARWGLQAAEALAHAHERGVIHRDVKPSNLILADDGRIWLTDFGLAKRLDDAALSVTGAILGTPRYMSPEQASAAKYPVDARTDIYSLGASLYELATGQPVFDADSPYGVINKILTTDPRPPRRIRPDLPRDLETVILRCLVKEPAGRYANAQELADDLRACAESRAIKSRRQTRVERAVRWVRKHRRSVLLSAGSAAAAVLLVVATLLGWSRYQQSQLGPIHLKTEGQPLTAELLDDQDRLVREFTVPTRQPVEVPAGDYQLWLSGKDRVGSAYQVQVVRRFGAQGNLSLPPRWLWEPLALGAGGFSRRLELDGGTDLIVGHGDQLQRRDGATGQAVWSVTLTPQAQPALSAVGELSLGALATAELVRPAPDLNGDGTGDLIWGWQGTLRNDHPPRTLLAMSGQTGEILWTFTGSYLTDATRRDGWSEGEVRMMGLPLVRDMDADGTPELLQPFSSQGFVRQTKPQTALGDAQDAGANIASLVPQHWTWVDVVSGRTGRWVRRLDGGVSSKTLPRIEPGFQFGLAETRIDGQDFLALVSDRMVRGIPLVSESSPPGRLLEVDVVGTPRLADLDGPAALVLQQAKVGEPATLAALTLPGGQTKWECPQIWPWTIQPNGPERAEPAEWPLVEDLDGDGRVEIVVPWCEWTRDRHLDRAGIVALDGASGKTRWRSPLGEPFSLIAHPRLRIGPDVDGDTCRDVFVAGLVRDSTSDPDHAVLVVTALSGKTGVACWRWQRAGRYQSMWARIDPLQWWQPGSDGHPQLLVACHGEGPPTRAEDRMVALTATTGQLAHTLHYPAAAAPEVADVDRDGIPDLVLPPARSYGEGTLRVVRGQPAEPWRRLEHCLPVQDFDGDGVVEVVRELGDIQTTCYSGRDGQPRWQAEVGGQPRSYALPEGDLDGDGTADILCVSGGGQFEPLKALSGADGALRWTSQLKIARSEMFHTLWLEPNDLDRDEQPEVVCVFQREVLSSGAGSQQRQRWLAVLSGQDGRTRWQQPLTAPTLWTELPFVYAFRPAAVDLDRDGVRDLVAWLATADRNYVVRAFRGSDGKTLWSRPLPVLAGKPDRPLLHPNRLVVAACDLHGDARPKVLVEFESSDDGHTPARTELWALNGADGGVEWRWQGPPKQDNAADLSDPTPLTIRRGEHHNIAVLTTAPGRERHTGLVTLVDSRGQSVATTELEPPDRRGGYASKLRVSDVDGDGQDELLWIGGGKLHAGSGDLSQVHWEWDLPAGRGELLDLPATPPNQGLVAVWSGPTVYGLDEATGQLRWHCEGPGAPARQLAAYVLGVPGAGGSPWVAFHEIYDPDNYANVSTVCRQALPTSTASASSGNEPIRSPDGQ